LPVKEVNFTLLEFEEDHIISHIKSSRNTIISKEMSRFKN